MRKIWLALIVVGLGTGTTAHAQEGLIQRLNHPSTCSDGCGHFCEQLKAWVCYRPLGCACTCSKGVCFPAVYLFFLDQCPGSQMHTLPCCCVKEGGIIRQIINNHGHLPAQTDRGGCACAAHHPGEGH